VKAAQELSKENDSLKVQNQNLYIKLAWFGAMIDFSPFQSIKVLLLLTRNRVVFLSP
jgi:hypothetical protein